MTDQRCPLSYDILTGNEKYSAHGLKKLHLKLTDLARLAFTPQELRIEAAQRADKMSIQGVQPKLGATKEEIALPIRGRKNNLRKTDFVDYFAKQCLMLNDQVIALALETFTRQYPAWKKLITASFLEKKLQLHYLEIIEERLQRFALIC